MAIDQNLVDKMNADMLVASSAGFIRRSERADEVAGQALEDVRAVASRQREDFHVIANLVLNRIAGDMTGDDDVIGERTLTERSVQDQPGQGTFNDPNYRAGASAPPGTKAQ